MIEQIREMAAERRAQAARLDLCDASLWLGRAQGFPLARTWQPAYLAAILPRYFIRGGLVSHWHSRTHSAQDGNQALAEALPQLPADCGVIWTGLPLLAGEGAPLPGLGALPERVCGVRLFPKAHIFPLADWTLGPLCEWLVGHRLPLFLWHTELEWSALRSLAKAFPQLRIVVESQPQKILYHVRPLFALLGECPNLLVETSNFIGQGVIEYVVREFGAERLLFGSFLPVGDPLVPLGMLLDAVIDDAAKALIAGGNLRRLMREVRR